MPVLAARALPLAPRRYARLWVPRPIWLAAFGFLRESGRAGREQLCFLAGRALGADAQVTRCVLPQTIATPSYVRLLGPAQVARILDALEAAGELPLASVHTHGDLGHDGEGPRHSAIDDHGVALTPERDGLFSLVVGAFARGAPFDLAAHSTLYERAGGAWHRVPRRDLAQRLVFHDVERGASEAEGG